jgi:hypothetical protein
MASWFSQKLIILNEVIAARTAVNSVPGVLKTTKKRMMDGNLNFKYV